MCIRGFGQLPRYPGPVYDNAGCGKSIKERNCNAGVVV